MKCRDIEIENILARNSIKSKGETQFLRDQERLGEYQYRKFVTKVDPFFFTRIL